MKFIIFIFIYEIEKTLKLTVKIFNMKRKNLIKLKF